MCLIGQLERYIGARGHHFAAKIREPNRRVLASAYGYAARFNESLYVSGNVILRELFQQTVSRELIEMMADHLSRAGSTKHRRDRAFPEPSVQSRNATQDLSYDCHLFGIERSSASGSRLDDHSVVRAVD